MMPDRSTLWDVRYEWKVVALLALGCGLVGMDRYMLLPLFPVVMRDLGLNYQELGLITGSLGFAYGLSALFMGSLADHIGRRKVVVASVLVFSLMVGITGLATGLISLCLVRAMMGLADGAYMTPAIVLTMNASKPTRQGRNLGVMLMMMPLLGLAAAPILVTQLLQTMSWRWIFFTVTPFGLLITALLYAVLRPGLASGSAGQAEMPEPAPPKWRDLLAFRNVRLGMVIMLCCLTSLIILSALLPNYLIDYLHLTVGQMGFVLSAIGFGGTVGNPVMLMISDRIGRKPTALICAAATAVSVILLMYTPADPTRLFIFLLSANFFTFPLIALVVGPSTTEAVSPTLMASATGLITCVGELLGGGLAPILGGFVAKNFGIHHIFELAILAMSLCFVACCFLVETAPLIVERRLARKRQGISAGAVA